MTYKNETYSSPHMIANAFAEHFQSVYLSPDAQELVKSNITDEDRNISSYLNIHTISNEQITNASKKLKNKLSTGPDNVPPIIVKDCIQSFLIPLNHIFNLIVKTGTFPDIWKLSRVCPVYKSDLTSNIINYRPIVLISVFSKLLEIILGDIIYAHVKCNIPEEQHGFVKARSTESNLCIFTQFTSNSLDTHHQVDVVYTDFSKAFDRVSHGILLKKLALFGFSTHTTKLLKSYLSNRKLFVEVEGIKSDVFVASSGIPQGSNLGPLLFLLFIADICNEITSSKLLFADDMKIYREIKDISDCQLLQNDLIALNSWCENNMLSLNINKCKIMTYHRKTNFINYDYLINNTMLTRVFETTDLGVTFDTKLTFNKHIENIKQQAVKMLGFVIRSSSEFTSREAICRLYFALIRSKLEYCSTVWNPHNAKYIDMIEYVQRKFLKYLFYKKHNYYPERNYNYQLLLDEFNFFSLRKRREIISLSFLHKIIHNLIDSPELLGNINFNIPRQVSRNQQTFYFSIPNSQHHFNSPITTMCRSYNNMPDVDTIDIFHLKNMKFRNKISNLLLN